MKAERTGGVMLALTHDEAEQLAVALGTAAQVLERLIPGFPPSKSEAGAITRLYFALAHELHGIPDLR